MPIAIHQSIIALIWDFDLTMIPNYMQQPLFKKYNINTDSFWKETSQLTQLYKSQGVKVNPDTAYLIHLLNYVNKGICKGLSNEVLREIGGDIKFFPGIVDFLDISKKVIAESEEFSDFDIKIEHYIVSTGLSEMIKGSEVSQYVEDIWGCEFIEQDYDFKKGNIELNTNNKKEISSIAYTIDNTTKTKALFEINKGVNKIEGMSVNQTMPKEDRRVPFENMIYIADGPSDVPAFSVIKERGGKTFAVYQKENPDSFSQVCRLQEDNRVHMIGEADYRQGTTTYLWLTAQIHEIARKIVKRKKDRLLEGKERTPKHLS